MSDFKDKINDLLEETSQDIDQNPELEKEFKKIQLSTDAPTTPSVDVESLREFTRASLQQRIELRFQDSSQFARSYVENISLGGLFLKTTRELKVGEIISIAFQLPNQAEQEMIELKAKVVNQRGEGFGLEFTNLDDKVKKQIESYIQQNLPQGVPLRQSKKASLEERLIQRRKAAEEKEAEKKKYVIQALVVTLLVLVNLLLGYEMIKTAPQQEVRFESSSEFQLEGKKIAIQDVQSVIRKEDRTEIRLRNGDTIPLDSKTPLPFVLRKSQSLIQSLPKAKPARTAKNVRHSKTMPGAIKKH